MIKHIWSVLCQRSVVDSQSNNISLIDVLERLEVNTSLKTPEVQPSVALQLQYEIVNYWAKTKSDKEEKADIKIVFLDPNKKELNRIEKQLVIPADKQRIREINKIQGITLTNNGVYNFIISIKQENGLYKNVAEIPLEVLINKIDNIK